MPDRRKEERRKDRYQVKKKRKEKGGKKEKKRTRAEAPISAVYLGSSKCQRNPPHRFIFLFVCVCV
jgi:hypothetical protein